MCHRDRYDRSHSHTHLSSCARSRKARVRCGFVYMQSVRVPLEWTATTYGNLYTFLTSKWRGHSQHTPHTQTCVNRSGEFQRWLIIFLLRPSMRFAWCEFYVANSVRRMFVFVLSHSSCGHLRVDVRAMLIVVASCVYKIKPVAAIDHLREGKYVFAETQNTQVGVKICKICRLFGRWKWPNAN